LFHVDFAPCPAEAEDATAAAAAVESLLKQHRGSVAAVIVEPLIQAAGGMLLSPPGFLRKVRDLCDRYDALLIVDEVATGFGRTGRMFACEHEGVSPDLMAVAKGLTGGYLPLAATLTTSEVYEAFLGEYREMKTFFHGHSYTGNPLACAAAVASLGIFETDRVIERLGPKIELVRRELARTAVLPHVGEIRQCGLMVGVELMKDREAAEPYPGEWAMGARVCRRARTLGLITRPLGDVVIFLPPLVSVEAELADMLAVIHRAIEMET
jgi:adenosylmethionine-8-amino-7-oxononanoate aminotransferase